MSALASSTLPSLPRRIPVLPCVSVVIEGAFVIEGALSELFRSPLLRKGSALGTALNSLAGIPTSLFGNPGASRSCVARTSLVVGITGMWESETG